MLTDKGNTVIPTTPTADTENYELLRKTALGYIQQFSGGLWTDYNLHDPGITIMELLCYSLTDLAYRTSFPVEDILTAPGTKGPDPADFYTARKILTSHPVTSNDYRKLILDAIPGVRNVWFETLDNTDYDPVIYFDGNAYSTTLTKPLKQPYESLQLKGLYVVKLEVEDYETIKGQHPHFLKTLAKYRPENPKINDPEAGPDEIKACLINYTRSVLYNHRNLCEDFVEVKVADDEWVAVCADIELKADADPDDVFTEMFSTLYNYVNPSLQFYSFKEMIEKGKRTEDIFNGPAMDRGFIDDDELANHGHKEVLYVSDIINLLMDIPGILQVKKIHLSSYTLNEDGTYTILEDAKQYCLHLSDTNNRVFKFVMDAGEQDKTKVMNHIRFSKGKIYFPPARKPEYAKAEFIVYPSMPAGFEKELAIPAGKNRNLANYYSLQNDFPLSYYTGMDGIPTGETSLRKAQRLQLKAFLLFFDQLLADYLAGLNNLKNIYSWNGGVLNPTLVPFALGQTHIKDIRKILASAKKEDTDDPEYYEDTYKDYQVLLETQTLEKQRRNKLLDHLLARFNEAFVDYSVFQFQQSKSGNFFIANEETIQDKIEFLKVYPTISGGRSHAFNYTHKASAPHNLSGLQLRIQKMLGLPGVHNRSLVKPLNKISFDTLLANIAAGKTPAGGDVKLELRDNRFDDFDKHFGIHVLEHILLRPLYKKSSAGLNKLLPLCGDGSNNQHADCLLPDNYSMQLTVVAPGWLSISSSMDFRAFAENLIRSEAPAHTALKICWLDPALMYLFETATNLFYDKMKLLHAPGYAPKVPGPGIAAYNKALTDVYTMMGVLKNMYLPSALDECDSISYDETSGKMKSPFILDAAALVNEAADEWYTFKK